jgi:endoglucanase
MRAMKAAARLAVIVACVVLAVIVTSCGAPPAQQSAASKFLARYLRPDGRVVRLDQGRDTVSEGQAYGMLLAEVSGDHGAFRRIWLWTHRHLQHRDGLFSFHTNPAGKVTGRGPASDADLLIAWALLRYTGPEAPVWHRAGRRVARAILAYEVASGPGGLVVLTAGPWATSPAGSTLDPSYWSLPAMEGLAQLTGSNVWHRLAVNAVTLTGQLSQNGRLLPPNWAELSPGGAVHPEAAPNGSEAGAEYGQDAARTVIWFAASCDPRARALAARWWPILQSRTRSRALALGLNGTVRTATPAPLSLVASAAAATSAGDDAASSRLLRQAMAQQRSYPTYYGGAWAALGLALLTPGGALDVCHPCPGLAAPPVIGHSSAASTWRRC